MEQVQRPVAVAAEQVGLADRAGGDVILQPDRTAANHRAELVEAGGLDEPKVRLRPPGTGQVSLGLALVEEFAPGGVIAAEHQAVAPARKVADHLQVVAARPDAGAGGRREGFGKAPEGAVHGHQQRTFADVADARPLGVPAVGAVVAVAGLRQAVALPAPLVQAHEQQRAMVPARAPDRIGVRMRAAVNAAGTGDFGELVAAHELPVLTGAAPLAERAARRGGIGEHARIAVAVVGVHQPALAAVQALAVVAGQLGVQGGRPGLPGKTGLGRIAVPDVAGDLERPDIDLIEPLFHGGVVDLVGGLFEVAGGAGQPPRHALRRDHADLPAGVDEVGADEQLPGLAVDQPVGRRAADAFRTDDLLQIGRDLVQLVRGAERQVRPVGDHPEPVRPGHHGAGAAFIFRIEHRQVRVDAADLARLGRGQDAGTHQEAGKQETHACSSARKARRRQAGRLMPRCNRLHAGDTAACPPNPARC